MSTPAKSAPPQIMHPADNAPRKVRCRLTDRKFNACPNEVLDPDGEVLLCAHHLAAAASEFRRITERAGR